MHRDARLSPRGLWKKRTLDGPPDEAMGGREDEPSGGGRGGRLLRLKLRRVLAHGAYFVPHGSLQFLLAVPTAVVPALLADGRVRGLDNASLNVAFSAGTAANALGKLGNGLLVDAHGARRCARVFLAVGVAACAAFAATTRPGVMFAAFVVLQYAASAGWLVGCRVIHDAFGKRAWTSCFAILSAASRVGSIASKLGLGALLAALDWQAVALAAAGAGLGLCGAVGLLLPLDGKRRAAPGDDGGALLEPAGPEKPAARESARSRVARLACDRALLLYCVVMAGATCVSAFDSLVPLLLTDLTSLSPSEVTMAATIFPLGLFSCVLSAPPLLARLEASAPDPAAKRRRRLLAELALLSLSLAAALGLAALARRGAQAPPAVVLPCLFCLAVGVAVTFYITPNVFALDVGGRDDCATASSILDTFGLVASSLWALGAGKIAHDHGDDAYGAWAATMEALAGIVVATAVAAALAVAEVNRRATAAPPSRAAVAADDEETKDAPDDVAARFV